MLKDAIGRAVATLGVEDVEVRLERPRDLSHGDWATNVAMRLAKPLRRPPREIAEAIVEALDAPDGVVTSVEIAGPGFINFRLAASAVTDVLVRILGDGDRFGYSAVGAGRRVNVEFVSANPTGPLHVGHGRGAALGDAIAALLAATGYEVSREFYVNDAGVQIDKLARSLWARVQQECSRDADVPEGGYLGEYLRELAVTVLDREGAGFADLPEAEGIARCRDIAVAAQRTEQDQDLRDFGVAMDVYYAESALYQEGHLPATLEALAEAGLTYERDEALWLETTKYGDSKDRVLRKRDGTFTYFLPDIAYHRTKTQRGFDWAIDVWGADHHGYVARMRAAMDALGAGDGFFTAVIVQLVRVMRGDVEVRFSKRSGQFVTLRDLYEETGVDAARYFFLMRRGDAQFVFDIDLATRQTDENPVYYVQYAHTRMAGIFRNAGVDPATIDAQAADLTLLSEPAEQELLKFLAQFPEVVAKSATALEPHRITGYVEELARLVNQWYHHHRVLGVAPEVTQARLVLARAAQIVLKNALTLLGVEAPERM